MGWALASVCGAPIDGEMEDGQLMEFISNENKILVSYEVMIT